MVVLFYFAVAANLLFSGDVVNDLEYELPQLINDGCQNSVLAYCYYEDIDFEWLNQCVDFEKNQNLGLQPNGLKYRVAEHTLCTRIEGRGCLVFFGDFVRPTSPYFEHPVYCFLELNLSITFICVI